MPEDKPELTEQEKEQLQTTLKIMKIFVGRIQWILKKRKS